MLSNLILIYLSLVLLSYWYCNLGSKLPIKSSRYVTVLSAAFKSVTKQRINTAIELKRLYPKLIIIASGKFHSKYMKGLLKIANITDVIIQSRSTNTHEDAFFTKRLLKNKRGDLILVTSPTHQRRAFHAFKRIFSNNIVNHSSSLFLSVDSILLPTGWISIIIELYKDIKYNFFKNHKTLS